MHTPVRQPRVDGPIMSPAATRSSTATEWETANAKARDLQRDKKLDEACDVWRTFLEQHPKDAEAANALGLVLVDLGRFEEALQSFKDALASRRGLISAKLNAGIALHRLKRFEEAISGFQDVLASNPN